MSNNYFNFKQFTITQNHSAMKVGTDGVLLGSWVAVENTKSILDIGTGTGLIALMLAQKCNATIDAIEIDAEACIDATFNFEQSLWNERLFLFQTDFIEYAEKCTKQYDCIVSNPPFFINALHSPNDKKNLARHSNSLPYDKLFDGILKLLTENGTFFIIVPTDISKEIMITARFKGLHPEGILHIYSKESDSKAIRTLVRFTKYDCKEQEAKLAIYLQQKGSYSEEYKTLTKDYYLAF
jgi:tRNA1Val (adenine37-N6)-methyltransferase